MKNVTRTKVKALIIFLVAIVILGTVFSGSKIGPHTKYDCDVKNLRLSTDIEISTGGEDICKVSGNIFRVVEDPLTMKDLEGNKKAYAGDDYHFISQDSHAIIVNGVVTAEMVGKFDLFGNTYDIYDGAGQKIGMASFNYFDTSGKLVDTENNLIAEYNSFVLFKDFDVRISEDCPLDHTTVLMLFCSYYSDKAYDNS